MTTRDDLYSKIPQTWLDVLHTIQTKFPEAAIAGGALRDLAFGVREPKDLDIFVRHDDLGVFVLDELRDKAGWHPGRIDVRGGYGALAGVIPEITSIAVPGLDIPVQVIHLIVDPWNLEAIVDRMDFGVCRLATTGRGYIYVGDGAFSDLAQRRITMLPRVGDVSRSLRRADRFRERYAGTDVTVVVPEDINALTD